MATKHVGVTKVEFHWYGVRLFLSKNDVNRILKYGPTSVSIATFGCQRLGWLNWQHQPLQLAVGCQVLMEESGLTGDLFQLTGDGNEGGL